MSIHNTARSAARSERRKRKFEGQCCLVCGYSNPVALVDTPMRKVSKIVLEQHHVHAKANASATVPLCRNHHAEATEAYLAAGIDMRRQPTLLHKIVMVLRSLSEYSKIMQVSFAGWADKLTDFIEQLDEQYPNWRDIDADSDSPDDMPDPDETDIDAEDGDLDDDDFEGED